MSRRPQNTDSDKRNKIDMQNRNSRFWLNFTEPEGECSYILIYNHPPATSDYRIALDQLLFCFEFHLDQIRENALSNQLVKFVLGDFNLHTAFENLSNYEHSNFTFFLNKSI